MGGAAFPPCCFSSVSQSCPTFCDPVDCSMPGFPVHNQLLELALTHVHWWCQWCHPTSVIPFSHQEASTSLLSLSIRGQTECKPQLQKTNQTDHLNHSLPCLTQWNYEHWKNMIHWWREWQTTLVFLPWEPHEQYEKAKIEGKQRY